MIRPRNLATFSISFALIAVLVACSSSPAPTTGSLLVNVTGLPTGVAGSVTVTGAAGYSQTITTTTTLDVAPGTYSVSVSAVQGNDSIVPLAYDGSSTPTSLTVAVGATTTSTVTYAVRPGSGHLWIPQFRDADAAVGYARSQLTATGSPSPDVNLAGTTNGSQGIAFDGGGNMWVSDFDGYLYRYDAADLATSGAPTAAVTIDATAYGNLVGLAFDASGNLWTSAFFSDQLLGYSPTQITADGDPTPAVVISANGSSLARPAGLAFDASGNLWVANVTASTVVQFSPAQLAATGNHVPTVTISASGGSLSSPYALALDAGGNLWVANLTNTVVRYNSSQIVSSDALTPAASIEHTSLGNIQVGLAFDANGALWVAANDTAGSPSEIRRFTNPGALSGSVAPTASVIITSIGGADGMLMAFSPTPANLPIKTP